MIADAAMTASGSLIELARRSWVVLLFVSRKYRAFNSTLYESPVDMLRRLHS